MLNDKGRQLQIRGLYIGVKSVIDDFLHVCRIGIGRKTSSVNGRRNQCVCERVAIIDRSLSEACNPHITSIAACGRQREWICGDDGSHCRAHHHRHSGRPGNDSCCSRTSQATTTDKKSPAAGAAHVRNVTSTAGLHALLTGHAPVKDVHKIIFDAPPCTLLLTPPPILDIHVL